MFGYGFPASKPDIPKKVLDAGEKVILDFAKPKKNARLLAEQVFKEMKAVEKDA